MSAEEELLSRADLAYNGQDVDVLLALVSDDVNWPNGSPRVATIGTKCQLARKVAVRIARRRGGSGGSSCICSILEVGVAFLRLRVPLSRLQRSVPCLKWPGPIRLRSQVAWSADVSGCPASPSFERWLTFPFPLAWPVGRRAG